MSEGEKRAVDAVREALRPLGLPIERKGSRHGPIVVVRGLDTAYRLAPLWAGEGFPNDVRRALDRSGLGVQPSLPVVVARRLSPGGREVAEEAGAGWADEQGNARIVARPALAVVRSSTTAALRATSGWSPSAGAVAELILTMRARGEVYDDVPPISMIVPWVDWSVGQVAKVLAFFDREGWTEKRGAERGRTAVRRLVDPAGLLSAWAAWHGGARTDARGFSTHFRDPVTYVTDRLSKLLRPHVWCVTGWLALEALAPFTTSLPSVDVYVDQEAFDDAVDTLTEAPDLRPVEEGARVTFIRAPRHVLPLASPGPAFPIASPVRVYGDLLKLGARGETAADRLREMVLGF